MKRRCNYFEDYGDEGREGVCEAKATLALDQGHGLPICVCTDHAARIVERFPELGGIAERFVSVDLLDEFGRLDRRALGRAITSL